MNATKMAIAALDQDGIIVSIVAVEEPWWTSAKDYVPARLKTAGFDYYEPDTPTATEIERNITSWAEFDEWVSTLAPA